ncbi:MAG: YfcE family phosphodiesterase [Candidatus Nanohaloarchaeota archaeon QJJ-7]|nr:YfcE family phosphodiesterase [Candidatus Nanohaloarchaeota archaeon QJJ-7]
MFVLSDIHGNLPALEAVRADAGSLEDAFFCGDLVGYYPWPDEVVDVARKKDFIGVRGNHDEALVIGSSFGFGGEAGEAIQWSKGEVSDRNLRYLEALPYTRSEKFQGKDVLIAHGSPRQPIEEYIYPERVNEQFLERQTFDPEVLLLGHTHVPFVKEVGDALVINPGSVGQPRDGDPRASYAELDLKAMDAEIHRVEYDIGRVEEKVEEEGLPVGLAKRLEKGR